MTTVLSRCFRAPSPIDPKFYGIVGPRATCAAPSERSYVKRSAESNVWRTNHPKLESLSSTIRISEAC